MKCKECGGTGKNKIGDCCITCKGTGEEPVNDTCLQETGKSAEYFRQKEAEMPEKVELKSVDEWVSEILASFDLSIAPSRLAPIVSRIILNARAVERAEDVETLREIYNKFYEAGGASMALEAAAQAIEEQK